MKRKQGVFRNFLEPYSLAYIQTQSCPDLTKFHVQPLPIETQRCRRSSPVRHGCAQAFGYRLNSGMPPTPVTQTGLAQMPSSHRPSHRRFPLFHMKQRRQHSCPLSFQTAGSCSFNLIFSICTPFTHATGHACRSAHGLRHAQRFNQRPQSRAR